MNLNGAVTVVGTGGVSRGSVGSTPGAGAGGETGTAAARRLVKGSRPEPSTGDGRLPSASSLTRAGGAARAIECEGRNPDGGVSGGRS